VERDPLLEVEALRELVRVAVEAVDARGRDDEHAETIETWLAEAEALLGSRRFRSRAPFEVDVFDRLAKSLPSSKAIEHPISVREFARHFASMGTLTIARGPHRGVYQNR